MRLPAPRPPASTHPPAPPRTRPRRTTERHGASMERRVAVLLGSLGACGGHMPTTTSGGAVDARAEDSACADADSPPWTLACTGLYADLAAKRVADRAR